MRVVLDMIHKKIENGTKHATVKSWHGILLPARDVSTLPTYDYRVLVSISLVETF
jgi:hypothetical protein